MNFTNIINCTSVFLNFIKSYKNMRLVFKGFLDSLKEKKICFFMKQWL